MTILLAEDEPMVADLLVLILKAEGHSVFTEPNGNGALQMFQTGEFDLVITDFHMPDFDGPALAKAIKAIKPEQKVMLLSGTYLGGKPPNIDYMMEKPVRPNQLTELLKLIEAT